MAGKGDRRRPTLVSTEIADTNYEAIFGKRIPTYMKKMLGTGEEALDAYEDERINEVSKLIAEETLQATEPKKEEDK
jgi:hypothetical protein